MTSYQNTEATPLGDSAPPAGTNPSGFSLPSKKVLWILAAIASMAILVGRFGTAEVDGTPMLGRAHKGAPSCTFKECYASNCDKKLTPFTCLFNNGGPHGGCSGSPWMEGTCETQCDLSGCAKLKIPHDTEDCDVPCDKDHCDTGRLCGSDVPFQCTMGASAFGCNSDKFAWTLRSKSTACSSCCNVNTC